MDLVNEFIDEVMNTGPENMECNAVPQDNYKFQVDELFSKVENLEERVNVIEQFYSSTKTKKISTLIKDKEKIIPSMKKIQQDATCREAAAAKRMQELMRQFGPIFRQITQHSCAWPFMKPVDVEGLGLHDYYKIIDRPMDFSTIKNQMEAMDGTGYKHVREIYADVCLVFKNAMKYNDRKSEVYAMAKTLREKFEEKWLHLLPKVIDEENRRKLEEDEVQRNVQLVQEAAHAKLARDLNNELYQVDMYIDKLREIPWAHEHEPINNLLDAVKPIKPTALIGTSGVGKQFTKDVVEAMASFNEKHLIMALSNPTSQAECTAEEAYNWTEGRAIFASGSPFDPVEYNGKTYVPGQANDEYIFPSLGLGLVISGAIRVHDNMLLAAFEALAGQVTQEHYDKGMTYPPPLTNIRKISVHIAAKVAAKAYELGLATRLPQPADLLQYAESCMYTPNYRSYR